VEGSVYQTVVRGGSPGGPQAVSEGKALRKLYQTLNERKPHPYMSVLKLSTDSRRISSFRNLSYNHYFRKYFKLVHTNVVMVTLTTGIAFLLFTCMYFWVWGILWRWSVCAPTAYEVVRDCRKFETQWCKVTDIQVAYRQMFLEKHLAFLQVQRVS
jgi:hypothetical protein